MEFAYIWNQEPANGLGITVEQVGKANAWDAGNRSHWLVMQLGAQVVLAVEHLSSGWGTGVFAGCSHY